ncbi:MAG: hypothetical protein R2873_34925 [Caldilineaceae bacterium]
MGDPHGDFSAAVELILKDTGAGIINRVLMDISLLRRRRHGFPDIGLQV